MPATKGKTAFDWDLYKDRTAVLNHYRQTGEYVDGVLESEDKTMFAVHLVVVSGLGSQITKFMYDQVKDTANAPIQIDTASGRVSVKRIQFPRIKTRTLKALIECAYTGELKTDVVQVWDVLEVGEMFAMKGVISTCCSFLSRHVVADNCVEMYRVGKSKRHTKLIQTSMTVMRRNIEAIVRNGHIFFQTIDIRDLKAMLSSDDLGVESEDFVWQMIRGWVTADYDARLGRVDYLLTTLRFRRTTGGFLDSLSVDPLIVASRRRGRSLTHIEKTWKAKTRFTYSVDGRGLPVGLQPESVRPRTPNSIIFGIGGWKGGRTTNLIETYDRSTNLWFELDSSKNKGPAQAYCGHQWLNGRILMIGGTDGRNIKSSVVSFDPVTLDWRTHSSMSSRRCYVATEVLNGTVYAIGGHNGEHRLRTVEKYDPVADEWAPVADMNIARSDAGSTVVDGKIYALGGLNENSIEASVEYYDPEIDKWLMSQEMSSPRTSLAVVPIDGKIYALGGNRGDSRLKSCEMLDPLTSTWSPISDMIDKRSTFSACSMDGKIYVAAGYDGHQPFGRCECYDPATDAWTAVSPMNSSRSGLAVVRVCGIDNGSDYTYCGNHKASLLR